MIIRFAMSFISLSENPGATARAKGCAKITMKIDITTKTRTPYERIAEVNLFASSFLFCDTNSEKSGINEVESAPVINI